MNLPGSWNKEYINAQWVYTPKNLEADKIYKIVVYRPEKMSKQDLHDWFILKVINLQKNLGHPLKKWTIKPEKDKVYGTRNVFKDSQGMEFSVGYQGIGIGNAHALIVQMISSQDWMLLLRYGTAFDDIVKDAMENINSER